MRMGGPMIISPQSVERLGIFREEVLGRVYEGTIRDSGRQVIVKEFLAPPMLDKIGRVRLRQRFLEEAAALKGIIHTSIAIPLSVSEEAESAYVIFHVPKGIPFYSYLQNPPDPDPLVKIKLFRRIVACYQLLGKNGISRFNVIPNDFFISENHAVQMVDTTFGTFDHTFGLFDLGILTGDKSFYAPEQIERGRVTERSLIFSLGLLAHILLTGAPAYSAESPFVTLDKILHQPLPALPVDLNAHHDMEQLLKRMLQKEETARFGNLEELMKATDSLLDSESLEISLNRQQTETAADKQTRKGANVPTAVIRILGLAILAAFLVFAGVKVRQWFFKSEMIAADPAILKRLTDARRALSNREWDNAASLARFVLNREADHPEANLLMGEAFQGAGHLKDAEPYLEKARRSRDPDTAFRAGWFLAEGETVRGNLKSAEQRFRLLETAAREEGRRRAVRKRRGELLPLCVRAAKDAVQNTSDAENRLRSVTELAEVARGIDPSSAQTSFMLGLTAWLKKDDETALRHLNLYLKEVPDDAFCLSLMQGITGRKNPATE